MERSTYDELPVAKGNVHFPLAAVDITPHGPIIKSQGGAWYRLPPKLQPMARQIAPWEGLKRGRLENLLTTMDEECTVAPTPDRAIVASAVNEIADRLVSNGATQELMNALVTRVAARIRTEDLADQLATILQDEIAAALPAAMAQRLWLQRR